MSEEIVPIPTPSAKLTTRTPRSPKKFKSGEFKAPTAAQDPQDQLEAEARTVEKSKEVLGYNVGLTLVEAGQRGFSMGLRQALNEGAQSDAAFLSECLTAARESLI